MKGTVFAVTLALAGAGFVACWTTEPPRAATPTGCGKDTDCKGARVCVKGACVEPPESARSDGGAAMQQALGATQQQNVAVQQADGGAPAQTAGTPLPGASPMFHVTWTHAGQSAYSAPRETPHEVARIKTGGVVYSSPAIASDGTAFFGSHDRAVRAATPDGKVRWSRPTGDLVWCSPALTDGNLLYVGGDDDRLYAMDQTDGDVRWTFTAGPCKRAIGVGPEAARCDVDGVTVGPDRTVYLVADGVYALKPDGTQLWHFALNVHCAGAPAVGPDGTVYAGCQDGALYALGKDGNKRWEFRAGDDVDSAPAVGGDGTVYFGSDDAKLYALGPNGALKWAVKTGGPVHGSPAIASSGPAAGTIYASSYDGALYAIRADGTVAWNFHAADRMQSSPTVDAGGAILVGSQDDRLYAVEADGKLRWSVLLGGDVDSTPALSADGTVYVGCDDGSLYLLR